METMKIRGKEYELVASRLARFRADHPDWTLTAEIVGGGDEVILMRATILDQTGRVISTGYAEEIRGQGRINETSVVENAETSAWGRALVAAGYSLTSAIIASAEEIQIADKKRTGTDRFAAAKTKFDTLDLNTDEKAQVAAALDARDLDGLIDLYRSLSQSTNARKARKAAERAIERKSDAIPEEWKQDALR